MSQFTFNQTLKCTYFITCILDYNTTCFPFTFSLTRLLVAVCYLGNVSLYVCYSGCFRSPVCILYCHMSWVLTIVRSEKYYTGEPIND